MPIHHHHKLTGNENIQKGYTILMHYYLHVRNMRTYHHLLLQQLSNLRHPHALYCKSTLPCNLHSTSFPKHKYVHQASNLYRAINPPMQLPQEPPASSGYSKPSTANRITVTRRATQSHSLPKYSRYGIIRQRKRQTQ